MISGSGSNMAALVAAAARPGYPAEIVLVVSNRPEAGGLAKAASAGIETLVLDHRPFRQDRLAFETALDAALTQRRIEFVALAGFMRVLTPWFVTRWAGRMVNIHPSLLPKHRGLDTHRRALEAGDAVHGCTVHWVSTELDAGAVIASRQVPVLPGDDAASLAARVLVAEHGLYPEALAQAVRAARPPGA
jgi:formyltetrahydrofolate-dependent phosphoribosylglycinamide formyltransferase